MPPEESWPHRLAAALREDHPVAPPEVVAGTGWTASELAAAVDQSAPEGPFDLVTLQIGVNDEFRGSGPVAFRPALRSLLTRAISLAGAAPSRVIVISIPDWSVTPYAAGRDRAAISRRIDEFNAVGRVEAGAADARYVEVTDLARAAGDEARMLAPDRLHPSGLAYATWVERLLPIARTVLAS